MSLKFFCSKCKHPAKTVNFPCAMCSAMSFEGMGVIRPPTFECDTATSQQRTKDTNPKDAIADKKAPLHLLSPIAMLHWALAQFAGMLKYGAWNWRPSGVRASVYIAAMDRHLKAYNSGERLDPVDGSHHLGNVMACCGILLEAEAAGNLVDDRPPVLSHRSTLEFVEKQMEVLRAQYADRTPHHYTIADKEHLPKL